MAVHSDLDSRLPLRCIAEVMFSCIEPAKRKFTKKSLHYDHFCGTKSNLKLIISRSQNSHCLAQDFSRTLSYSQQRVNIKTNTSTYSTYKHVTVASKLQCLTMSHVAKKMFYHSKNERRQIEVCGREYFHVCVPAKCRTLNLHLQDHNYFPGLSRSWKFYQKLQNFPGGMGTLISGMFSFSCFWSKKIRNYVCYLQNSFYVISGCLYRTSIVLTTQQVDSLTNRDVAIDAVWPAKQVNEPIEWCQLTAKQSLSSVVLRSISFANICYWYTRS